MIKVSKEVADYIRSNSKNIRIAITGKKKHSRAKKYYVDESYETFGLLKKFAIKGNKKEKKHGKTK